MANKSKSVNDYFSTDHLNTDLKRTAVRGAGITVFSRIALFFIQVVGTMVLARLLIPDDFGLVAMVTSITGFFIVFKDLGLTDATIQEKEINNSQISTLFWINVASGFAVALLIVAISPLIAWFFGKPELKLIVIISSLNFVFAGLSIQHFALLKRNMLFFKIAIIEIITTLMSIITVIILAWHGWGYWSLVARPITYAIYGAAGVWVAYPWRPRLPDFRSGVRSMLAFGANGMGFFFVNYFSKNLDKTLIGWRYGAKDLGYYHKAYHLCLLPTQQLTMALRSVAIAALSKLREEPVKFRRYYIKAISTIAFIGMPMCAFMVAESHDLILLVLGPQWDKTAEILSILGIGAGLRLISSTGNWLHLSLGRADRLLRWGIISSSLSVIAILVGLPFGSNGVAIAYTLTFCILIGPGLSYAGKPVGLKFSSIVMAIWSYFFASILAGLLSWYFHLLLHPFSSILGNLFISLSFFATLYLALIVALFRSMKPIKHFFSLIAEMFPNSLLIKLRLTRNSVKSATNYH